MEKQEFFGEWWTPDFPDKKFIGKIEIDNNSLSVLEINGRFKTDSPEIILGINNKGDKITLIDNYLSNYEISKTELCRFNSYTVIFSKHFNSIDSIKIKSLNVYFKDLEKWTCFNSIEREVDFENKVLKIITKDFNEKELFSNEIYSIKLHNKCNWLQNSIPYRNIKLSQTDFFIISFMSELTLNEIKKNVLQPLKLFLTLSMSNPTYFNHIVAYDKRNSSFDINFHNHNKRSNNDRNQFNMLFILSKISDNFGLHYSKWLKLLNTIKPIHSYYFEVLEHASINHFYNRDFWSITVALESLHRCIYEEIDLEESKRIYQSNLDILKEKLTKIEFKEISKYLLIPTEMNLRKRLTFLFKKFPKFSKQFSLNSKTQKSIINKVIETRNFHTHLDKSKKYNTVNDDEFFDFMWLMMRLFELCMLESIGFDEETALKFFENYEDYKIQKDKFMEMK